MISVIVPIYNVEDYLNDCVQSICLQSYKNLEIILVDDGSKDRCPAICDEWATKDTRIKVIHKDNGGLSDARNAGIEIAKGEYITFVDSDDVIASNMIDCLMRLLHESNVDMAVCQRMLIDENGNILSPKNTRKTAKVIEGRENCMRVFFESSDIDTVAWGKIYKTSMFDDIRFPKGRFHEDVFTTYKLVAKCESVVVDYKRMYLYRVRIGSITQIPFTEKHLDAVIGKEEQYEFVRENFPRLITQAQGGIIFACNQCVLRLAKSNAPYQPLIDYFKIRYKRYVKSYLRGNYSLLGKIFALACRISPTMVIKGIRIIRPIKK